MRARAHVVVISHMTSPPPPPHTIFLFSVGSLQCGGSVNGVITASTPSFGGFTSGEQSYTLTLPAEIPTSLVTFSTCGSTFDVVIRVFDIHMTDQVRISACVYVCVGSTSLPSYHRSSHHTHPIHIPHPYPLYPCTHSSVANSCRRYLYIASTMCVPSFVTAFCSNTLQSCSLEASNEKWGSKGSVRPLFLLRFHD
jgi:hypothetical protein